MADEWSSLENATWGPMPCLGPEWLGKSSASDSGYAFMLTDGCGVWGESRVSSYVQEKAEEWAPCIEAGEKEIASLVLEEVKSSNVKANWKHDRRTVTLNFTSRLNDLAFKWIFCLNRLSDEVFREHWVIPQVIQMHHLDTKFKQLKAELKKRTEQLEELMPENKNNKKSGIPKKKDPTIDISVEAVMAGERWVLLQDQLVNFPNIMKKISVNRKRELEQTEEGYVGANEPVIAKKGRTEAEMDEELQRREKEKEKERRAQIQELQQGTQLSQTPTKKKKKKLNI